MAMESIETVRSISVIESQAKFDIRRNYKGCSEVFDGMRSCMPNQWERVPYFQVGRFVGNNRVVIISLSEFNEYVVLIKLIVSDLRNYVNDMFHLIDGKINSISPVDSSQKTPNKMKA